MTKNLFKARTKIKIKFADFDKKILNFGNIPSNLVKLWTI